MAIPLGAWVTLLRGMVSVSVGSWYYPGEPRSIFQTLDHRLCFQLESCCSGPGRGLGRLGVTVPPCHILPSQRSLPALWQTRRVQAWGPVVAVEADYWVPCLVVGLDNLGEWWVHSRDILRQPQIIFRSDGQYQVLCYPMRKDFFHLEFLSTIHNNKILPVGSISGGSET